MLGTETIKKYSSKLEGNLKKELRDQGHYLTGNLERSINTKISGGASVVAETEAAEYMDDLETGIPASQIPTGAAYIQELAEYARLRFGASGRQALQIGYAIAKKHKKEGMPTAASYEFSSTGSRTEAIDESFHDHEQETEKIIDSGLNDEVDDLIDKTFNEILF